MTRSPRAAILTHGIANGGGVPRVAEFIEWNLMRLGFETVTYDLATSRHDANSSRLALPRTWLTAPKLTDLQFERGNVRRVGTRFVEFEPCRYLPRTVLTQELEQYDLIQVVCGSPAWANVVRGVGVPTALQAATTIRSERQASLASARGLGSLAGRSIEFALRGADRAGVRLVDHVLTENVAFRNWCTSVRGSSDGVSLIPPGIDTEFFSPSDIALHPTKIVAVGRLGDPRKGWHRLFRCFAALIADTATPPRLMLVGRGRLSESDSQVMRELSISHLVDVNQDATEFELLAALRSASVFVQTSYEEGLGLAALEAMACGVPVVATDTHGTREYVIEGETGFLLTQDDSHLPRQFVDAIRKALGPIAPAMRQHCRELCVKEYSREASGDRIAAVYESMIR